jgi:hypothetical protein
MISDSDVFWLQLQADELTLDHMMLVCSHIQWPKNADRSYAYGCLLRYCKKYFDHIDGQLCYTAIFRYHKHYEPKYKENLPKIVDNNHYIADVWAHNDVI